MSKYQRKPIIVDAFRWTGGPDQTEDPEWAVAAIKAGIIRFENDGRVEVRLVIHNAHGAQVAKPGDYLTRHESGQLTTCDPGVFHATYSITVQNKTHELKTDPDAFDAVVRGQKTFEIRRDDRGYKVGDTLILRRTKHTGVQMNEGYQLIYTGEREQRNVTHILRGPVYGLEGGWVIMSLSQPKTKPATQRS